MKQRQMMKATPRVMFASALLLSGQSTAAEWYEEQTFRHSEVTQVACDVIVSPFTKWIKGGLKLQGLPATGKLYATLPSAEATAIETAPNKQKQMESYDLTNPDSIALAKIFTDAADTGVPFYVQIAAGLPGAPAAVGMGLTVMDYLVKTYPANKVHPVALAEVTKYGGSIVRILTVSRDQSGHPWVGQNLVLRTTINNKTAAYVLCSADFALKLA